MFKILNFKNSTTCTREELNENIQQYRGKYVTVAPQSGGGKLCYLSVSSDGMMTETYTGKAIPDLSEHMKELEVA